TAILPFAAGASNGGRKLLAWLLRPRVAAALVAAVVTAGAVTWMIPHGDAPVAAPVITTVTTIPVANTSSPPPPASTTSAVIASPIAATTTAVPTTTTALIVPPPPPPPDPTPIETAVLTTVAVPTTGEVVGTVMSPAGGTVGWLPIVLTDASGVVYRTTSDAAGAFRLASLAPGALHRHRGPADQLRHP
ncbi:MAG TPA: hypothetical protein PLV68_16290, partial [Ilumatobacteraceae bacterium]|nr:hypothetical protein [Ilumatobacteraceae bacterium]